MLGIWVKFDRIVFWFSQVFPVFLSVSLLTESSFLLFENLQKQQRVFQQNQPRVTNAALPTNVRSGVSAHCFALWVIHALVSSVFSPSRFIIWTLGLSIMSPRAARIWFGWCLMLWSPFYAQQARSTDRVGGNSLIYVRVLSGLSQSARIKHLRPALQFVWPDHRQTPVPPPQCPMQKSRSPHLERPDAC